jgi:hypothetical protein
MIVVTKFKYLGVELHGARARPKTLVSGTAAWWRPSLPSTAVGMFAAATAAMGSYGCEVWFTPYLGAWRLLASRCRLQSPPSCCLQALLGRAQVHAQPAGFL